MWRPTIACSACRGASGRSSCMHTSTSPASLGSARLARESVTGRGIGTCSCRGPRMASCLRNWQSHILPSSASYWPAVFPRLCVLAWCEGFGSWRTGAAKFEGFLWMYRFERRTDRTRVCSRQRDRGVLPRFVRPLAAPVSARTMLPGSLQRFDPSLAFLSCASL